MFVKKSCLLFWVVYNLLILVFHSSGNHLRIRIVGLWGDHHESKFCRIQCSWYISECYICCVLHCLYCEFLSENVSRFYIETIFLQWNMCQNGILNYSKYWSVLACTYFTNLRKQFSADPCKIMFFTESGNVRMIIPLLQITHTISQNNRIQYLCSYLFSSSSVNQIWSAHWYIVFYFQVWEPEHGESGTDLAAPVIVAPKHCLLFTFSLFWKYSYTINVLNYIK